MNVIAKISCHFSAV